MEKEIKVCPQYTMYIAQLKKEMYAGLNAEKTRAYRDYGCDECKGINRPQCQIRIDLEEIFN